MTVTVTEAQTIAFDQVKTIISENAEKQGLTDLEMIALTANLLGKMCSIVQHRVFVPQMMEVIRLNMKLGWSQGDAGK